MIRLELLADETSSDVSSEVSSEASSDPNALTVQEEAYPHYFKSIQNIGVMQLVGSAIIAGCLLTTIVLEWLNGR